ncbi:MAG: aldo/keto reductase [Bryobacteraceae bacterium]
MDRVNPVPAIGLGCVTFGREIGRDHSFRILDHAFERGVRFLDTAEAYGSGASERVLGEWIASRGVRDSLVIETKALSNFTAPHLLQAISASLDRLRIPSVDVYLLHQPDLATPLEETLDALAQLRHRGLLRRAGCSNFSLPMLEHAERIAAAGPRLRLDITQPNYNLAIRDIEGAYIGFCQSHDIEIVTYSPLAAGFLTGKYSPAQPPEPGTRFDVIPGHRDIYFTPENFHTLERLRAISFRTGLSMPQLAMRWVFENPGIQRVLVGARDIAQLDNAFAARNAVLHQDPPSLLRQSFLP